MGKDASTIRQEIEETRERMGDTVEALAYKTDVQARVKDSVNDRVDAVKGTLSNVVDNVKSAVVGAGDSVRSTVSDASDSLSSAVDTGTRNGTSTLSQTRDAIGDRLQSASDRIQSADVAGSARRAVGAVQENPIGLAIAALAIGFLTGSLLPVSDEERKRVGPLRDKLVDQATAAANDLVEAGKAVALETITGAASAAVSSAQSHGHDVVDAAKGRAQQN